MYCHPARHVPPPAAASYRAGVRVPCLVTAAPYYLTLAQGWTFVLNPSSINYCIQISCLKKNVQKYFVLKKILVLSKVCGCNAVLSRAGRRAGGGWCGSAHVRHHSVSSRPGGGSLGCAARCCCCWPHSSLSFCSVVPPPPRHAAPPATTSPHSDNIGHLLQRRRGVTAAAE